MAATNDDNVSYRLLEKVSDLVVCSRCLQNGVVTPVPQIISRRHKLNNVCSDCRAVDREQDGKRRILKLVTPRR